MKETWTLNVMILRKWMSKFSTDMVLIDATVIHIDQNLYVIVFTTIHYITFDGILFTIHNDLLKNCIDFFTVGWKNTCNFETISTVKVL